MVKRVSDIVNGVRSPKDGDVIKVGSIPSENAINFIEQVIAPAAYEDYTLIDYVNTVPHGRNVPVQGMLIGGRNNSMTVVGGEPDFDFASYALSTTKKYGGGGKIAKELRWGFMRGNVKNQDGFELSQGRRVVRPMTPLDWFVMPKCEPDLSVDIDNVLHKPEGVTKTPSGDDLPLFNFYLSDVTTGGLAHEGQEEKHTAIRKHLASKVWDLFGKGATELLVAGIVSNIRWDGNTSGAMEIIVPVWALYAKRIHQENVKGGGDFTKAFEQMKALMGGAVSKADLAKGLGLAKNASKLKLKQAFAQYDANKAPFVPSYKPAATPLPKAPAATPPAATPPATAPTAPAAADTGAVSLEELELIAQGGNVNISAPPSTPPVNINQTSTPKSNTQPVNNPLGSIGIDLDDDEQEGISETDIPQAGSFGGLG